MGMTIDKAAYIIGHHKVNDINNAYDLGQAFTVAIEIMHKYQKIEQIIKDRDYYGIPEDYWYIDKIREVLEDGNNT